MTDLITEARELCADATPGPWECRNGTDDGGTPYNEVVAKCPCCGLIASCHPVAGDNDAAFIARSRTLIPELCDALEKAERESGCEWCADNYDHRHKTMFRKGSDWNYEAKYCDMCGKRLEEHHEAD